MVLLLTQTLNGQITLKKVSVLDVKNPTLENGVLFVDSDSQFNVVEAVVCKYDETYKFNLIKATKDGEKLEVKSYNLFRDPGAYKISVTLFDPDKGIQQEQLDCVLGQPKPPTPPTPPGPTPPTPIPDDQKLSDLSVLLVYESAKLGLYTEKQKEVISSVDLRNWVSQNLARDQTTVVFAVLDQNTPFPPQCDTVYCKWLGQMKNGTLKAEVPSIIMGNKSKIVYQGPLPSGDNPTQEVKNLILKYKK